MHPTAVGDSDRLTRRRVGRLRELCGQQQALLLAAQRACVDGRVLLWDLNGGGGQGLGCGAATAIVSPLVLLAPDAIQELLQSPSGSRFGGLHCEDRRR